MMPVFLPGESHGQRSLAGCSPRVEEGRSLQRSRRDLEGQNLWRRGRDLEKGVETEKWEGPGRGAEPVEEGRDLVEGVEPEKWEGLGEGWGLWRSRRDLGEGRSLWRKGRDLGGSGA